MKTNAIIQFAEKYLAPYRIRGDELIPELCPFCRGGDNEDRRTFALHIYEGVYVCKRGSCGVKGRFDQLAAHYGEQSAGILPGNAGNGNALLPRRIKQFELPDTQHCPLTETIISYFASRKISRETLEAFRIAADPSGNIIFPFYRGEALIYEKYRKPHKPKPKERKEWQFSGAQPILFGMDMCSYSQPLIITEGQIDAMVLYEAGIRNVVSVPSGCDNLDWIEYCWDWLEQFRTIVLFGDNDDPGKRMVQNIARRIDEARCMIVEDYPAKPDGTPCKDANEILFFCGAEAVLSTLASAQPMPIKGIVQLADVVPLDPTTLPRVKTMIPALDEAIGGLVEGGMTVFTGKPGDGKSTLAGLLLLNAIEQGQTVCAYSGELTKERFQSWIHFQLAGSDHITLKHDPVRGVDVPFITYPVRERLIDYYRDKFLLFDNNEIFEANQSESILKVFTMVARRFGCKLFLVDNMMTSLSDADEETKAQGRFANALKKFANRYQVHVLLVAHPRKTKAGEYVKQDDIGGSSATIRLADSAIVVERPNLRIIKNRDGGIQRLIECCYCPDSRRIYQADKGDLNRFNWDKEGLTPASPRADSLREYGIRMAEANEPF